MITEVKRTLETDLHFSYWRVFSKQWAKEHQIRKIEVRNG